MKKLPNPAALSQIIWKATPGQLDKASADRLALAIIDASEEVSAFDYVLAMERREKTTAELCSQAGRRFHACRDLSDVRSVISALPESTMKPELTNMANLLLRLILVENDGGPISKSSLNPF